MDTSTIPAASGIYRIICQTTGKLYIGSAQNLHQRCFNHFNELERGVHHNIKLQRAYRKYGPDAFVFEIIEFALPPFLIEREQYWIDKLQPQFNIAPKAGSRYGMTASPETRLKQSEKAQKRVMKQETKDKIAAKRLGQKAKPATIEKLKNRVVTPEHRAKIGAAHSGKTISPEQIEQLRQANQGRPAWNKGLPGTNLGKTFSQETKNKMSEAADDRKKMLIATSPDGQEYEVHGASGFCKEHRLPYASFCRVARGERKSIHGWTARFVESDAGAEAGAEADTDAG